MPYITTCPLENSPVISYKIENGSNFSTIQTEGEKMKRLLVMLFVIALFSIKIPQANAHDRRLGGVILGTGTGAIVGHAIGHNAESTIVGATLGGVLGLIVCSEIGRHHHKPIRVHHYRPHHYRDRYYHPRQHHHRPHFKKGRRHHGSRHYR